MTPVLLVATLTWSGPRWLQPGPAAHSRLAVRHNAPTLCAVVSFDEALAGMQRDLTELGSAEAAVDTWLSQLDEMFIPTLANKLEATPADSDELAGLLAIMGVLQQRSVERFERARDQLETLLTAGEINKLDSQLCGLIRRDELDAGFLYVLFKNMEAAEASGDEEKLRLLSHLHTRTQEELEKKSAPGLGLLHKLTRTPDAGLRDRIIRHHMSPQTEVLLPDGQKLPLAEPKAAMVDPLDFAGAVEDALNKVLAMPLERQLVMSTVEEIRTVAKEARAVVESEYPAEVLDSFTEALTPAFSRAWQARGESAVE